MWGMILPLNGFTASDKAGSLALEDPDDPSSNWQQLFAFL